MIVSSPDWIKIKSSLSDAKMWLFFTTANLAIWHGVLTHRINSPELTTTLFFWLVALFVLWKKRNDIYLVSQPWKNFIGIFLLAIIIYRGLALFWYENFVLQFIPFFSLLSLALIASGWKGLKQYTRPLIAFLIFSLVDGISEKVFTSFPDGFTFPKLTADFSTFFLHYIGFDVSQEGVFIYLPDGSVEVLYACTGGPLIGLLLQLTFVLFIIAPLNWKFASKILIGLLSLGFFLGVVRVALLAVVVSDPTAFEYWHGSEGSQIFSLAAFSIWIVSAHFIYEHYENQLKVKQAEETTENSKPETASSEGESTSPPESNPSRLRFLSGLGLMISVVTLFTFFFPEVGRRQVPPLNFPSQLSLKGWTRESSVPLTDETDSINDYVQQFRSGQQYLYRQQNQAVTVELRHIGGTFGNVGGFASRYLKRGKVESDKRSKTLPNLGAYQLYHDESYAYLSTCITSQGESTTNIGDFVYKMNRNLLKANSRLWSGVIGTRSLRERNCLWVHLSTPLQENSPEASYQRLEAVFQEGYPKWQALF